MLLIAGRCNVVVSGATSSGKTSLLNTVLGLAAPGERIVTIEDTAELLPAADHLVRLEARPPTPDGPLAVTLEQLVRTALRLRPDRLVVGEVRGPEVLALVQALNTGHDGSWSTCHANSALDALHRLETLVIQAAPSWPLVAVRQHLTRSIDVVVHLGRGDDGARRVVEIGEVVAGDRLALRPILRRRHRRRPDHAGADVSGGRDHRCRRRVGGRHHRWPGADTDDRAAAVDRSRRTAWARLTRRRRAHVLGEVEVAAWCERVAAGVRAGSSLTAAVVDADAATVPAQRPFPGVGLALARGRRLAEALDPGPDGPGSAVGLLAPVLVAAAELGGPAASALDRVADTLLARAAERAERRTSSAQARLSARVLTMMPFGVLGVLVLTEPAIRDVVATPAGTACVVAGCALNGLGWWWMRTLIVGVA